MFCEDLLYNEPHLGTLYKNSRVAAVIISLLSKDLNIQNLFTAKGLLAGYQALSLKNRRWFGYFLL